MSDGFILVLEVIDKTKGVPHLLFYGPSGVGKSSAILAAARELGTTTLEVSYFLFRFCLSVIYLLCS